MMLEQNHAGLDKLFTKNKLDKNGVSKVLVPIFLILIVISAVFILWSATRDIINKAPLKENCVDFIGISIEEACYLNNNEIKIRLEKGTSKANIQKIGFSFLPSNSLWEISGEKCLDARLEERRYGSYCDILDDPRNYVFNTSGLEIQDTITVAISGSDVDCFIGEREIKDIC